MALLGATAALAIRVGFFAQPPAVPPPFTGPGIALAPIFTDHAVLQRAPSVSAVYGVVVGDSHATGAVVSVTADGDEDTSYSVTVKHIERVNATYFRWKVALRPTAAGSGSHTVTATCVGCQNPSIISARAHDLVFGDVYVCSGRETLCRLGCLAVSVCVGAYGCLNPQFATTQKVRLGACTADAESNMWLPMHFSLSRNITYDAILQGRFKNIRMITLGMNMQLDNNLAVFDPYIGVPAKPYSGVDFEYPGGGWLLPSVGDYPTGGIRKGMGNYQWNNNTVDTFSAACFHFAEGLTELAEQNNETIVPYGLISSSWGGTVVEVWTPNATLHQGKCSYVDGNTTADYAGTSFGPRPGGSLWTGMIAPLVNYTIFGAIWYQGENNVFQCQPYVPLGDPNACGHAEQDTGYGCFMAQMVGAWRHAWSTSPMSGTSPTFPFGIVSLAGGTSEGHSNAMPAFRNAQTAGGGLLPNKMIPNSFVAQAFDAGEPAGEVPGGACEMNDQTDEGGFPCRPGFARFTPFFMGGIHPRAKRVIGQRLAKAARNIAYGDTSQPYTGPVLVGCELAPDPYPGREPDPKHALPVPGPRLRLTFNATLLGTGDSLTVRQPGWELQIHGPPNPHTPYPMSIGLRGQPFADLHAAGLLNLELLEVLTKTWRPGAPGNNHNLLYTSPLEVRYGGSLTNLSDGGVWLSARLEPLCYNKGQSDSQNPSAVACGRNSTTGERLQGWNVASAAL